MDAGHYVRHASRALRARPALTLVCVSIIALGIGASTAVASAVHALLMLPLPLPLPHAERLVTGFALREGFDPFGTCILEYEAFGSLTGASTGGVAGGGTATSDSAGAGAGAGAFERIGLARRQPATLRAGTDSVRVQAAQVTGSYLATCWPCSRRRDCCSPCSVCMARSRTSCSRSARNGAPPRRRRTTRARSRHGRA